MLNVGQNLQVGENPHDVSSTEVEVLNEPLPGEREDLHELNLDLPSYAMYRFIEGDDGESFAR